MKINEMTGERVKNNSNRVVFLIFFFFVWCVWCEVKKRVALKKKMSGVEKKNGMESKAKSDDREY